MKSFPEKLSAKIETRLTNQTLRQLPMQNDLIDFSSNDYLGFATSEAIFDTSHELLKQKKNKNNGATGSRLLTGNHTLYQETEVLIANFHKAETALIFNSGYDANIGFFSSVPQRGSVIFYDEYIHASIRDGIGMSNAQNYKFQHNNLNDLSKKLSKLTSKTDEIYVVTESVFSMDGDSPNLEALVTLCKKHQCYLIIDEAHAMGLFGKQGGGLLQELGLTDAVFARIITFGKALGCHGAAILGTTKLKQYLINFARSFIYTTGLPPHALATIQAAYQQLHDFNKKENNPIQKLHQNITYFNQNLATKNLNTRFIPSSSAIHCAIIPGNSEVQAIAQQLHKKGFNIKPILSPTVPEGEERLRFCLHSYNSTEEISDVLELLATFVAKE